MPAVLLLADGRFPAGGHAHSGGIEAAVNLGLVNSLGTLGSFLRGRLRTAGLVGASLSALAAELSLAGGTADGWDRIDCEADARTPSNAAREASRAQGRQLLRSLLAVWPDSSIVRDFATLSRTLEDGTMAMGRRNPLVPHHAVALGVGAVAGEGDPTAAAYLAAYGSIANPAGAAVRLLGLDPREVTRLLADLGGAVDAAAQSAVFTAREAFATDDYGMLPMPGAPVSDMLAEIHLRQDLRLFSS